jgi:hypothetical protein
MDWNCTESDKRLSDYLDRLTTPEETAAFSAHIEHCAACADLVARVGGTVRMLRATAPVEVPPQLFAKIVAATSGTRAPSRGWRRWLPAPAWSWQPQFAMGAITVAASFLIVFHAANASHGAQALATLNPVNLFRAADRQAHVSYAHTAKFVNDMRLVYEIQSRLEPDQDQQSAPAVAPSPSATPLPGEGQPKTEAMPHPAVRAPHPRAMYAVNSHTPAPGRATRQREFAPVASAPAVSEAPALVPASFTEPETLKFFDFAATRSRS